MTRISLALGVVAMCATATMALGATGAETNAGDRIATELKRVGVADKHAFVLFHRKGAEADSVRATIKKAIADANGSAEVVEVDVADPSSALTVRTYGINRAPLPLVLVIAPNGAVTGGFPGSCDAKDLGQAMVGKTFAACLKSLQAGKLVFVTVAGTNAANNQAAMKGVTEMKADERFAGYTETLPVQATDKDGGELLAKLKVTDTGENPVTILLAPPGGVVGTYTGATDKATMVEDLMKSMAGATCGGGGCGSGASSCGPR